MIAPGGLHERCTLRRSQERDGHAVRVTQQRAGGAGAWDAPRLAAVADGIEARFGAAVHVDRRTDSASVTITPPDGACPLHWIDVGDELIFGAGEEHCRWELGKETADLDFIEAVVEAVVAGRVWEVFGPARSQLTVHLLDGTEARAGQASGARGCLPVPGWAHRGRRLAYRPYP